MIGILTRLVMVAGVVGAAAAHAQREREKMPDAATYQLFKRLLELADNVEQVQTLLDSALQAERAGLLSSESCRALIKRTLPCETCGKPYEPYIFGNGWCSPKCAKAAQDKRAKLNGSRRK